MLTNRCILCLPVKVKLASGYGGLVNIVYEKTDRLDSAFVYGADRDNGRLSLRVSILISQKCDQRGCKVGGFRSHRNFVGQPALIEFRIRGRCDKPVLHIVSKTKDRYGRGRLAYKIDILRRADVGGEIVIDAVASGLRHAAKSDRYLLIARRC